MELAKQKGEFLAINDAKEKIYIPVCDVKFIFASFKTSSIIKILANARNNNKLFRDNKKEGNTIVVTANDDVFVCKVSPYELVKRCEELGYPMLGVSEGYFIASFYIKVLCDLDSILVSSLRKNSSKAGGDLQFVHQNERRKTAILLKTNQMVFVSRDSRDIVTSGFGGFENPSDD